MITSDFDGDIDQLKEQVVGCGIIPVSIDNDGEFVVLLGQERYINHWRGSLKWSAFEGGRKFDESVEFNAAREFIEESMGVLSFTDQMEKNTIEDIISYINQKKYFLRILLRIVHESNGGLQNRYQLTYVVHVPYQKQCPEKFSICRNEFMEFHNKLLQFHKIMEQLPNEPPFLREGSIVKGNKVKAVIDVSVFNKYDIVVTYLEQCGIKKFRKELNNKSDALSLYLRWYSSRIHLNNEIPLLEKSVINAINVERNCLGFFVNAKLHEEYFEKQQIKWWKLRHIKEMLSNCGNFQGEYFRAYFIPVLQRTVYEIDKYNRRENDCKPEDRTN